MSKGFRESLKENYKDVIAICCLKSELPLKRHASEHLCAVGIKRKQQSIILNPDTLNFIILEESKSIISVNKQGVVKAIGKKGEKGYILIQMKNDKEKYCTVEVIVR